MDEMQQLARLLQAMQGQAQFERVNKIKGGASPGWRTYEMADITPTQWSQGDAEAILKKRLEPGNLDLLEALRLAMGG